MSDLMMFGAAVALSFVVASLALLAWDILMDRHHFRLGMGLLVAAIGFGVVPMLVALWQKVLA